MNVQQIDDFYQNTEIVVDVKEIIKKILIAGSETIPPEVLGFKYIMIKTNIQDITKDLPLSSEERSKAYHKNQIRTILLSPNSFVDRDVFHRYEMLCTPTPESNRLSVVNINQKRAVRPNDRPIDDGTGTISLDEDRGSMVTEHNDTGVFISNCEYTGALLETNDTFLPSNINNDFPGMKLMSLSKSLVGISQEEPPFIYDKIRNTPVTRTYENTQYTEDKKILFNVGLEIEVCHNMIGLNGRGVLSIEKDYGVQGGSDSTLEDGVEYRTGVFPIFITPNKKMEDRYKKLRRLYKDMSIWPVGRGSVGYYKAGGHIHISSPHLTHYEVFLLIADHIKVLEDIQKKFFSIKRTCSSYWITGETIEDFTESSPRKNICMNSLDTCEIRLWDSPINVEEIKVRIELIKLIFLNKFTKANVNQLLKRYGLTSEEGLNRFKRISNESERAEINVVKKKLKSICAE